MTLGVGQLHSPSTRTSLQEGSSALPRLAQRLHHPLAMSTTASVAEFARANAFPGKAAGNHSSMARAGSSDFILVAQLRAGEESALVELVRRYQGVLLGFALSMLPNRATAEEVVQDTWACAIEGIASFEGRSSLKTWICRILANRAKTRLIREARSVPFSALTSSDSDHPAVDPDRFSPDGQWAEPPRTWNDETPEKSLMQRQAMGCLEKALQELPAAQRAVVTLRDIEGLDSEEVCNVLNIRETNQRVLLHRARSKLRRALEEHLIGA